MAKLGYQPCVARAFEPLIKASGRSDLANQLRALPPESSVRNDQFARFASLRSTPFPPLFLPNGGFLFPFFEGHSKCFAFSSFLDEIDLERSIAHWLRANDAILDNVNQSRFLFLAYYAADYFALRPEAQVRRSAEAILELVDDPDYKGHNVDDLIRSYRPVYIVSLPSDSILSDADPFSVGAELISMISELRSPIIDQDFAEEANRLLGFRSIRAESVFLALISTRWRYTYLEIFRIIESALYVPWIKDMMNEVGGSLSMQAFYTVTRKKLEWRETKGKSIERLFALLADGVSASRAEAICPAIAQFSGTEKFSKIGAQIYKIRNQLVHPEDFTDQSILEVTEDEFRALSIYLVRAARRVYHEYDDLIQPL